jgi:hypothetical protein
MIGNWILVLTWLLGAPETTEAADGDNRSSLDPNG